MSKIRAFEIAPCQTLPLNLVMSPCQPICTPMLAIVFSAPILQLMASSPSMKTLAFGEENVAATWCQIPSHTSTVDTQLYTGKARILG